MVAAATYRKREVEDEDEEAVHESAGDAGGRRRMDNPYHTQTSSPPARLPAAADVPKPAPPASEATPPRRERWREKRGTRRRRKLVAWWWLGWLSRFAPGAVRGWRGGGAAFIGSAALRAGAFSCIAGASGRLRALALSSRSGDPPRRGFLGRDGLPVATTASTFSGWSTPPHAATCRIRVRAKFGDKIWLCSNLYSVYLFDKEAKLVSVCV